MEPSPHDGAGAGGWQQQQPTHPREREARRRAVAAAYLQLVSPFLFAGMLFLGLAVEIPTSDDMHGYTQIFGFFGSILLLIPGIAFASVALRLLRGSRRSGAVWLIVASALSCLEFLGLASGAPGGIGELEWSRVLTIAVGVIWLAVSGWCVWAGTTAYGRLSA